MGYWIECSQGCEDTGAWAQNIVDLLDNYRDSEDWFLCNCGARGYIRKSYELQEPGETWEPILKGAIRLGGPDDTYQPFVFLAGYKTDNVVDDVWFAYYKDLRSTGGRLKQGHGPGGPPVLGKDSVLELVLQLVLKGCIEPDEIRKVLDRI